MVTSSYGSMSPSPRTLQDADVGGLVSLLFSTSGQRLLGHLSFHPTRNSLASCLTRFAASCPFTYCVGLLF